MDILTNKKTIFSIAGGIVLLGIIGFIFLYAGQAVPEDETPTEEEEFIRSKKTGPKIKEGSLDEINKKGNLSAEGAALKEKIIQEELGGESGTLLESRTLRIYYLKPVGNIEDEFSVEIRTRDIQAAKDVAWSWLKAKGFSDKDLCNLKVVFGTTPDVKDFLEETEQVFSPVFEGC